jgi:hypothetical protein
MTNKYSQFSLKMLLVTLSLFFVGAVNAKIDCNDLNSKCLDTIMAISKERGNLAKVGYGFSLNTAERNKVCGLFGRTEVAKEKPAPELCQNLWAQKKSAFDLCGLSAKKAKALGFCE